MGDLGYVKQDRSLRGAISLTPWLKPGDHDSSNHPLNRFNGFQSFFSQQTVKTVLEFCGAEPSPG
jgi:hypothetical protein